MKNWLARLHTPSILIPFWTLVGFGALIMAHKEGQIDLHSTSFATWFFLGFMILGAIIAGLLVDTADRRRYKV